MGSLTQAAELAEPEGLDYDRRVKAKSFRCGVFVCLLAGSLTLPQGWCPWASGATVTLNGAATNQVIDGFGANINHRSWNNDELKPVLDALIDQAGLTLFRVIYDKTNWEATNDNSDPNVMNWSYYGQIYSSADFQKMWGLAAYLNQKGISNGLMFNFQGNGPSWLGGGSLSQGMEAEWAEMIASLLIYAHQTNHLQFSLVGPDNEMDQVVQGVDMTVTQYTNALHKLSQLLDTNGLSDLRFVGPDLAAGGTTFMPQMMGDPILMSKLAHFGVHSYSDNGGGSSGVAGFIQGSAYSNRNFWVDEFNVYCAQCDQGGGGTNSWTYASAAVRYLSDHLANGAAAGLVWEGYDSQYNYFSPGEWSFWGLFAVDDTNAVVKTYTPRKIFYTLSQVTRWVPPGAQLINVGGSTSPFSPLLAFKHTGFGQITIVGINTLGSAAALAGTNSSMPVVPYLDLYYTSAATNLAQGGRVGVTNGVFSAAIPADCVFTLVGGIPQVSLAPVNAVVVPGNTQQFTAIASNLSSQPLNPQPAFSWSASGGGQINGAGLFTAGNSTGGPFNIIATAAGGMVATATVSVVSGTMLGNTNQGAAVGSIWTNGAWIYASRFQAASNGAVSTILAKLQAISGSYKAAIYADAAGAADALLGVTAETASPSHGWRALPLVSSVGLTGGSYYWLAIWSDDPNAGIYYSGGGGTLGWGRYDYGSWPDPLSLTGGGSLDFCIFATGLPYPLSGGPANTLIVMMAPDSFLLRLNGVAGTTYRIEYADTLVNPVWQTLGNSVADDLGVVEYTDVPPQNSPARYYRVVYP
jgi:hypothetical protein